MKKTIRNLMIIFLLFIMFLLLSKDVFANNIANSLSEKEYSNEFKEWLNLSDEEKQKVMMPRIYDIESSEI